jgi:hypothetical protein
LSPRWRWRQSPAVNPTEAGDAKSQQQRQVTQPLNNQPVWSEIRSGLPQVTTVRGRETNVLIQSEGQTWRAVRVPILFWGGILLATAVLGLAGFYLLRGTMGTPGKPGERVIERFSPMDRYAHWFLAIVWVALAITGLILSLGKAVLLPLVGLYVVLLARHALEDDPQFHRSAAHHRRPVAVRPVHPRQRDRRRGLQVVHQHHRLLQGSRVPVGPLQRGREARLLAGPHLRLDSR